MDGSELLKVGRKIRVNQIMARCARMRGEAARAKALDDENAELLSKIKREREQAIKNQVTDGRAKRAFL